MVAPAPGCIVLLPGKRILPRDDKIYMVAAPPARGSVITPLLSRAEWRSARASAAGPYVLGRGLAACIGAVPNGV